MDTIENVKKRVGQLVAERNLSFNSLSLQLGKNSSYLQKFVKEKSPKRLDEQFRKGLAILLNVDEQELTDLPLGDVSAKLKLQQNIVSIDVLDVSACCGNGWENFTENVIGKYMMTMPALRELTSSAPENIKIIKAIGDSMMPTIYPGDVVWVDISFKEPTSDGLYLLAVGKELMIKRIQINPFDNSATIKADNPQYEAFKKENYQDIDVIGKIIYHVRKVG